VLPISPLIVPYFPSPSFSPSHIHTQDSELDEIVSLSSVLDLRLNCHNIGVDLEAPKYENPENSENSENSETKGTNERKGKKEAQEISWWAQEGTKQLKGLDGTGMVGNLRKRRELDLARRREASSILESPFLKAVHPFCFPSVSSLIDLSPEIR
jgi:hypothetical protein